MASEGQEMEGPGAVEVMGEEMRPKKQWNGDQERFELLGFWIDYETKLVWETWRNKISGRSRRKSWAYDNDEEGWELVSLMFKVKTKMVHETWKRLPVVKKPAKAKKPVDDEKTTKKVAVAKKPSGK